MIALLGCMISSAAAEKKCIYDAGGEALMEIWQGIEPAEVYYVEGQPCEEAFIAISEYDSVVMVTTPTAVYMVMLSDKNLLPYAVSAVIVGIALSLDDYGLDVDDVVDNLLVLQIDKRQNASICTSAEVRQLMIDAIETYTNIVNHNSRSSGMW